MPDLEKPVIASVDRLRGGVLVTFTDGRAALYSSELLLRVFSEAEEQIEEDGEE